MKEASVFKKILINNGINISLLWIAPIAVSIVTIGVYNAYNDTLDISIILFCLTIFNMIQYPLRQIPYAIASVIEIIVSLGRIEVRL